MFIKSYLKLWRDSFQTVAVHGICAYFLQTANKNNKWTKVILDTERHNKQGSSSRWVSLIPSNCKAVTTLPTVPITGAGYLLLVIFCSPSTSSGVITVFLRNSSSVLTGIPMSDELQPCCTFMSDRRGLLGA